MASPSPRSAGAAGPWNAAALLLALLGSGGSLWLSIGMDLKPCPLCYYQRTFVLSVAGVLLIALVTSARRSALPAVLSLPAGVGGLCVAVFHVFLELSGRLECPLGVLGWGTAPQQSLAVFAVLTLLLGGCAWRGRTTRELGTPAILTGFVLGVLFAAGTIASAPPMPAAPTTAYEEPLTICRPPFRPA